MRMALFTLLTIMALAQSTPARHFKDGEVLKLDGAEITIRMPPPPGPCVRIDIKGVLPTGDAACAGGSGAGFFQVHVTDKDVDYIEIQIGRESYVSGLKGPILLFQEFSSPAHAGVDYSVGEIQDLDRIRTIKIRLLKVKTEAMFR